MGSLGLTCDQVKINFPVGLGINYRFVLCLIGVVFAYGT
jgi:hypothetical protein